jgi:hypothetical protein
MPLQIRRGTDAERTAMTQPLAAGELIFVTNTNRLYIGNGATNGGVPVTDYTDEQARDAVAPMLVNGTHNAISFVYDDALDKINATVNLSDYQGVIKAAAFNGSVVANDSSLLIDGNTGKFNLSGRVGTDIIPDTDVAYDLGSATYRFRDLYLSGSSIKLGAATITATGTAVNLPAGSTIGGLAIGMTGGDLNVNIVANDSTVIVNTTTEVVTAQGGFVGNVTGNVTGNATSVTNGVYITDTGTVTNTMLAGSIEDTKLSTISTAGKVSNSATTATNANTASAIVSRDSSGNFLASTITSNLIGNVTGNVIGSVIGDLKGSVFGDDSTKIIDSVESKVYGGFVGSLNGNRVTLDQSLATTGFIIYSEAGGGAGDLFNINTHHNSADPTLSYFTRSRGTFSAPTPLLDADLIYGLAFSGRSSDGTSSIAAAFGAGVAGTPAAGILPGSIILSTNTAAGALTPKLIIGSDGLQTVIAPALVAGGASGQVNTGSITSWMKVNFNGVDYAVPMYAIRP